MQNMSSGIGLVHEQAWEDPDVPASPYGSNPATASIGFANGKAAGSASPLIWAQAQYLRLVRDLQTGTVLDRPAITVGRYVTHGPPARLKVSITRTVTSGGATLVTGTAAPGSTVDVTAARPASGANVTTVVQTVAGAHGTFRVAIPTPRGETAITAAASAGKDATGWAQKKVRVR
jgi:glucoamylase